MSSFIYSVSPTSSLAAYEHIEPRPRWRRWFVKPRRVTRVRGRSPRSFPERNRKVHTGLLRPCLLDLGLVERNAVKGECKDRRLSWINSDSIPVSIPTRSPYIGSDAKD